MAVAPAEPAAPPAAPATPPAAAAPPAAPAAPAPGLGHVAQPPAPPATPPAEPAKFILKQRPEWLGEGFWNKDTGEVNVEGIAKNAADLKAKLSTGTHKPPATADGYAIDFSKETDADIKTAAAALIIPGEDGSPDPVLTAVQADAFKEGVSVHAFNTVLKSYLKHVAATLPEPFDQAKEMAKLGQNGPALIKVLNDFADDKLKRGFWTDDQMQRWKTYLYDAEDAKFLHQMLFEAGVVSDVKIAALNQAAATPDAAALDAEQRQISEDRRAGKITDAQAQQRFDELLEKRKKLVGTEPQRAWPPPAA